MIGQRLADGVADVSPTLAVRALKEKGIGAQFLKLTSCNIARPPQEMLDRVQAAEVAEIRKK